MANRPLVLEDLGDQQVAVASPRPRPLASRLSFGHLVMIVAGLLTFVLIASVLQDRGATVTVAVAARALEPGTALGPGSVRYVEVAADSALGRSLLNRAEVGEGKVAVRRVAAGEPLTASDLRSSAAPAQLRAMSLAVSSEHAVGGQLAVGDRVDIVTVEERRASYIARDVEVLAVPGKGKGGIGSVGASGGGYFVTVAVDGDVALRLAVALREGKLEILRSTGAAPPTETSYDAGAAAKG
jgi:Flp pilus assembly protein CpaB